MLEARPTPLLVRQAAVFADLGPTFGEHAARHPHIGPGRLVLLQGVEVVKVAQEEQVGDLIHHPQWVGDTTEPEGVPNLVDLGFDDAGDHVVFASGLEPVTR